MPRLDDDDREALRLARKIARRIIIESDQAERGVSVAGGKLAVAAGVLLAVGIAIDVICDAVEAEG